MPELLATAALTATYASAAGPALLTVTWGGILNATSTLVGSPACELMIGGGLRRAAPPRPEPAAPSPRPDGVGRVVVLARDLGVRCSIPYGPRAYVTSTSGVCLEPMLGPDVPLLVDPDAQPEPGDVIAIWTRESRALAFGNRRGPNWLLDDEDLVDMDAELREVLSTHQVAPAGAWTYAKRLLRPLPPRETWAADTNFSLVVEMLNPRLELRAHLAGVTAIDKVVAALDFSACPTTSAWWADAMAIKRKRFTVA